MLAGLSPAGEKDGRPTLNFGHVEEPHYPWTDYPDGTGYGQATEDFRSLIPDQIIWRAEGYTNDRATQAHLLEVGYVDHIVGRIIDRLKANGQWDKSLVVFTADHGGSLIPNLARREAVAGNVGEVATVPLTQAASRPCSAAGPLQGVKVVPADDDGIASGLLGNARAVGNADRVVRMAQHGWGQGVGVDQNRIPPAMVMAFKLDDLPAARVPACQTKGRHRRLGPGIGEAHLVDMGQKRREHLGHLHLHLQSGGKMGAAGNLAGDGLHHLRVGMAKGQRAKAIIQSMYSRPSTS